MPGPPPASGLVPFERPAAAYAVGPARPATSPMTAVSAASPVSNATKRAVAVELPLVADVAVRRDRSRKSRGAAVIRTCTGCTNVRHRSKSSRQSQLSDIISIPKRIRARTRGARGTSGTPLAPFMRPRDSSRAASYTAVRRKGPDRFLPVPRLAWPPSGWLAMAQGLLAWSVSHRKTHRQPGSGVIVSYGSS